MEELDEKNCIDLKFLALYKSEGIYNYDGILGFSPINPDKPNSFNFLKELKETGIIENSMISFSLASVENSELKSYALFGGYNSS